MAPTAADKGKQRAVEPHADSELEVALAVYDLLPVRLCALCA